MNKQGFHFDHLLLLLSIIFLSFDVRRDELRILGKGRDLCIFIKDYFHAGMLMAQRRPRLL